MGVHCCPGAPGSGKTTGARAQIDACGFKHRFAVDDAGSPILADLPLAPTIDALIEEVYGAKRFVRWRGNAFRRREEFERVMMMVYELGDTAVLIDDAQKYANNRYCSPALVACCTEWRPKKLEIYITTQRFAWLHQDIMGCITDLKVYRATARRDRKLLDDEFDMDPERLRALGRGESIDNTLGFTS